MRMDFRCSRSKHKQRLRWRSTRGESDKIEKIDEQRKLLSMAWRRKNAKEKKSLIYELIRGVAESQINFENDLYTNVTDKQTNKPKKENKRGCVMVSDGVVVEVKRWLNG